MHTSAGSLNTVYSKSLC